MEVEVAEKDGFSEVHAGTSENGSKSDLTGLLNSAVALVDRRVALCKQRTPCPKCGTNQVQLVDWLGEAKWKCRHCSHRWSGI